jgi:thiamine pyrophosphokinase
MLIFVFANGEIEDLAWIRPLLPQAHKIMAADGGSHHLYNLQRVPDVVIGDLDSLSDEVRGWLDTAVPPPQFITHPAAKDETDLELALLYAAGEQRGRGASLRLQGQGRNHSFTPSSPHEIWVFGALGGRLDQTLANILLLAHPALADGRVILIEQYQRAWLVAERTEIQGQAGDTVSLIPLGGDVRIARTHGLRWPLQDDVLAFGPARGVSNVMLGEKAAVVVGNGRLLCIHTQKAWQR